MSSSLFGRPYIAETIYFPLLKLVLSAASRNNPIRCVLPSSSYYTFRRRSVSCLSGVYFTCSREPPSSTPAAAARAANAPAAGASSSAAQQSTSDRGRNAAQGAAAAASPPNREEAIGSPANGTGRPDGKTKKPTRGASSGAEEEDGSNDDAESDHADTSKGKGKGKARRGRNSAASRGGDSPAVSAGAEGGGDGERDGAAAADTAESPSELLLRKEPYTTDELVAKLNILYSKAGQTLDIGFYNKVLGERANGGETNTPAETPSPAVEGDNDDIAGALAYRGRSVGGAAAKSSGKRQTPGGSEEAAGSSTTAAHNKEENAAGGVASTAAALTQKKKRRLAEEQEEPPLASGNAAEGPSSGKAPGGTNRRASGSVGSAEPPQQPMAKRHKEGAADGGEDLSCVGSGGEDFGENSSCGDADSDLDEGSAPPPSRPLSSRREGASKPALERAKAKAILAKSKVGAAKRDRTPLGAAASGPGASYLIPKKTAAAAAPTAASSSGSVGGGAIPKKIVPKKSR